MKRLITFNKCILLSFLILIVLISATSCARNGGVQESSVSDASNIETSNSFDSDEHDANFLDSLNGVLGDLADYIESNIKLEYTIRFTFEDLTDRDIIEERLIAMGFTIKTKDENGVYEITSPYVIRDGLLDLVCSNNKVSLVDESDNIFIDDDGVLNSRCSMLVVETEITKDAYDKCYDKYRNTYIYAKTDNGKYPINILLESENGIYTLSFFASRNGERDTLTEEEKAVISANIYYATEPINDKVTATIIEAP